MRNRMQMTVGVVTFLTLWPGMPALAQEEPCFEVHEHTFPLPEPPDHAYEYHQIDFDSDGDLDQLVVTNMCLVLPPTPAPLQAMRNMGNGILADASEEVILGDPTMIQCISSAVADFDGDGRDDIFLAGAGLDRDPFGGEQSRILMQTADGKLNDETSTRLPVETTDFGHDVGHGDFDGINGIDIFIIDVFGGGAGTHTRLLMNDGSGVFTADCSGLPAGAIDETISCAVTDTDKDGDLDLVLGTNGNNGPRDAILLNDGSGSFFYAPDSHMPLRATTGGPQSQTPDIAASDLDNDGYPDLLMLIGSMDMTVRTCQMLLNNGDGSFRDATDRLDLNGGTPLLDRNSLCLADFNGDGWTDFTTALLPDPPKTGLFLNCGQGYCTFPGSAALLDEPSTWNQMAITRFADHDGDSDLFNAWHGRFGVYWILENVRPYDVLGDDTDGDGLANGDETLDLDPLTPGVQNPFHPFEADSTGDEGSTEPDGVPDGQNDWDGDGMANGAEFEWGFDPLYAGSYGELPATRPAGRYILCLLLTAALVVTVRRRRKAPRGA